MFYVFPQGQIETISQADTSLETASQSSLALSHDPSLLAAIGAGGPQGEQQN